MQQPLTDKYAGLLVLGFLVFASMHAVSLARHYGAFFVIEGLAIGREKHLVQALGPPNITHVFSAYTVTVCLAVAAIRWQISNPGVIRQKEMPLWMVVALVVVAAAVTLVVTTMPE